LVSRERYIFAGIVMVLLGALVAYALHLNKDEFVKEMTKTVATFAAGALSGAGAVSLRKKGKKQAADEDGDDE